MARDPYKYFRIEAQELIDQLSRAALDLEKGTTPEIVAQLLRLAHTLKGAARVVKRADIGDCAHAIEDTLAPLRESKQQATQAQIDTLLKHIDDIHGRLASLSLPAEGQITAVAAHAGSEEILRTVRVDVGEMDTLLDGFGEVHTRLGTLRESLKRSEDVRSQIELLAAGSAFKRLQVEDVETMRSRTAVEQLGAAFDGLQRSLGDGIEQLDRELKLVRDAAERMRLIPADSLFVALERAVRDAAQVQNKKVVFEGRGGDVRLDAQVLGAVQAALSHVVRNAVTHGIEAPTKRQAASKPAEGRVTVKVVQRGRWIDFICTDDGGGINLDAIRRIAEQRGLLAATSRKPDAETLMQLLLKGGISTSETITEVAGRGVGLDVVRDAAERLDGKVELHTDAGKGTTVTLTVPLLIASLDGLLVETGGIVVTLPIESIRGTLRIAPGEIARTSHGESIIHEGRTIPFLSLATVLSVRSAPARTGRVWSAVVVGAACGMAAIGVERLLGAVNVVLRPLPMLAPALPIVAGVSLDVEGNPQLVLDPENLIMAAQRAAAPRAAPENASKTILVIDDSLTTRMLERSILESAGYTVELAVSAEEAMEKVARSRYALFLVDVEMPGMDGFTFIEKIRANPEWRDIPAILVTSLASEEYLQRGRDVGAQGYIVKSEFDQGALLSLIGELVA
jgi:two-component system chemotaxis sensor kinase CheA